MSEDILEKLFKAKATKKKKEHPLAGIPAISSPVRSNAAGEGVFGVEIEFEGRNNGAHRLRTTRWTAKGDGSLRGGDAMEFVFTSPYNLEKSLETIDLLYKVWKEGDTEIRPSNRTSTHVHLNVGGFKANQLTSFFVMLTTFEDAFINWAGIEKKTNHFCLSNSETNGFGVEAFEMMLDTGAFAIGRDQRYSATNLAAFQKFGSFEVRYLPLFTEAEPLKNFIKVLNAIREAARKDLRCPSRIPQMLSENTPEGFLRIICEGHDIPKEFIDSIVAASGDDPSEFNQVAYSSFRNVQSLCWKIKWEDYLEEFDAVHVENPFEKKPKRGRNAGRAEIPQFVLNAEGRVVRNHPPEEDVW